MNYCLSCIYRTVMLFFFLLDNEVRECWNVAYFFTFFTNFLHFFKKCFFLQFLMAKSDTDMIRKLYHRKKTQSPQNNICLWLYLTLLTLPQWINTVAGDETGLASQLISTPILPTRPTKDWPQHQELHALLFSIYVWVLWRPLLTM